MDDFAALRKLREDDESGALKEFFGDGEDPREWKLGQYSNKSVTVTDGRVTELSLSGCSSLAALPDAIGELGALTELNLSGCSSLAALPAAIGELKALTELDLSGCSSLAALPAAIGKLGALTKLNLYGCSSLAALPDAIGELKALTELYLPGCSSLEKLPDAVAAREGLTVVLPDQLNGPLQEDFAALRKLRDLPVGAAGSEQQTFMGQRRESGA